MVVATDKWRGSFSSVAAGKAIATGLARTLRRASIEIVDVADGGEGTLEAVLAREPGERRTARVADPLGRVVDVPWALLGDGTALLESATAIGHARLGPEERRPPRTSTRGVGDLVRAALDAGCSRMALALGGSVTVDGGAGFAQALGARIVDAGGGDVAPGGGALVDVAAIDVSGLDSRLAAVRMEAWCDVRNPLVGLEGAARVFGPQKGAGPSDVERLEGGLIRFADAIERDLGVRVHDLACGGAAGGLGAAALAFAGAALVLGAERVLDAIDFDHVLEGADLVVTGEGRFDGEAMQGKIAPTVAERASRRGIPAIVVCGEDASGGRVGDGVVRVVSGVGLGRAVGDHLSATDLSALGDLAGRSISRGR